MGLIGRQGRVCEEFRRESFFDVSIMQFFATRGHPVKRMCRVDVRVRESPRPFPHSLLLMGIFALHSAGGALLRRPLPRSRRSPSFPRSMSANLSLLSPPDCATTTAATLSPSAFSDKPISRSVQRQARDGGERVGTDCMSKMLRMGKQHVDVGRRRILRVRRDGCHRSDDARPRPVKSSSAPWAERDILIHLSPCPLACHCEQQITAAALLHRMRLLHVAPTPSHLTFSNFPQGWMQS